DAAGAIDDHVVLHQRVARPRPEVDGMLGQAAVVAMDSLEAVVPDDPALGAVGIDAAGVAAARVGLDPGAAGGREEERRAFHQTTVDPAHLVAGVDLDELLAAILDVHAMDTDAGYRNAGQGVGVDGVISGTPDGHVGDGDVGSADGD